MARATGCILTPLRRLLTRGSVQRNAVHMYTFWCRICLKKNSLFCLFSCLLDLWFLRGLEAKYWKHWSYAVPEFCMFSEVEEWGQEKTDGLAILF